MAHNGYIQLLGKTSLAASVTPNGVAALRQGTEFSREISFANTSAPRWESLLTSDGSIFTTTEAFIPLATTSPSYDNDGNLTADGQFLHTWDALNRLTLVRRSPAALTAGAPFAKVSYQHDAAGRMFLRQVFANDTAATDQDKSIGKEFVIEVHRSDLVLRDMGYFSLKTFSGIERRQA